MPFFTYNLIGLYVVLGVAVVKVWYWLDMRSVLKWKQRKAQLTIEGRWQELEKHFDRAIKTRWPFVWYFYRCRFPGNMTAQHALFLFKLGHLDEALAKADLAIREANGMQPILWFIRPRGNFNTHRAALRARALALNALGRADEAREAAGHLKKMTSRPESIMALIEFFSGNLDKALTEAQAIPAEDAHGDAARGIVAVVYTMKGEFDRAIQTLLHEPGDITKFYAQPELNTLRESAERAKLLKLRQKKRAGVVQPARFLRLAEVYLSMEDFKNADLALDQAEKCLGSEPAVQMSYCSHRARSFAGQGKAADAESYIERMRAIIQQRPKRSLIWEAHFGAGQSYFYLHRFAEALAELSEAQRSALHPIEKHFTAYWTARTYEAVGDREKASPFYQTVALDPIPSWIRKRVTQALGSGT